MILRAMSAEKSFYLKLKEGISSNLGEKISNVVASVRTSFWLIPASLVSAAIALALVSVDLDHRLSVSAKDEVLWLFSGKSSAARALLSAIAGSLITVISISFSVTLIAIQQAATQYSPRILTRFTKDRGNQFVLGTFMATFVYALLVLRDVRSAGEDAGVSQFIPALSITIALLLTLLSVGLLVYFFHHITQQIQVSTMLAGIRGELNESVDRLYPEEFNSKCSDDRAYLDLISESKSLQTGYEMQIKANVEGHIRNIDISRLFELTAELPCHFVWVPRAVGEYLVTGATLVRIWSEERIPQDRLKKIRSAFLIGPRRTIEQDPIFGIQQINDVAVKALSPGVNDPTTAEQCLMEHKGFLARMLNHDFPAARVENRGKIYLVNRPGLVNYFDECLTQIRVNASGSLAVLRFIAKSLEDLLEVVPNESRKKVVIEQLHHLLSFIAVCEMNHQDQATLEHIILNILRDNDLSSSRQPGEAA